MQRLSVTFVYAHIIIVCRVCIQMSSGNYLNKTVIFISLLYKHSEKATFIFHKVVRWQFLGEVAIFICILCQIPSEPCAPKIIKICWFLTELFNKLRGDVFFWNTVYLPLHFFLSSAERLRLSQEIVVSQAFSSSAFLYWFSASTLFCCTTAFPATRSDHSSFSF